MKQALFSLLFGTVTISSAISKPAPADDSKQSELVVELQNCQVKGRDPERIELEFLMSNKGPETIVLAERWNSWGANQWSFRLTDAKGNVFDFVNPQRSWWANHLTTFEIHAGKPLAFKCRLNVMNEGHGDSNNFWFSNSDSIFNLQHKPKAWIYPIRLEGIFSAPVVYPSNTGNTNWTGSIAARAVILEKNEAADAAPQQESFIFTRSSAGEGSPESSIATIVAKPDGQLVMRFDDSHGNPWEMNVKYITFRKQDGSPCKAIDGSMETKDDKGGSGTFSMRLVGQVMADGSMEGSFVRITSPGYLGADTEVVSVRKFTMRPSKHGKAEGDHDAVPSD